MIVFKTVREHFTMLGAGLYQPDRHFLFNFARIKVLLLILLNFISYALYAFSGADNFLEYINTVFLASVNVLVSSIVSYCIWKTEISISFSTISKSLLTQVREESHLISGEARQTKFIDFVGVVSATPFTLEPKQNYSIGVKFWTLA